MGFVSALCHFLPSVSKDKWKRFIWFAGVRMRNKTPLDLKNGTQTKLYPSEEHSKAIIM